MTYGGFKANDVPDLSQGLILEKSFYIFDLKCPAQFEDQNRESFAL